MREQRRVERLRFVDPLRFGRPPPHPHATLFQGRRGRHPDLAQGQHLLSQVPAGFIRLQSGFLRRRRNRPLHRHRALGGDKLMLIHLSLRHGLRGHDLPG